MKISNAKYSRPQGSVRNRAYLSGLEEDADGHAFAGADFEHFLIPRYEEMTFLDVDELT